MARPFTVERLEMLLSRTAPTFWRHDVDCSLESALMMAVLEHDMGVTATYYLMQHTPFYSAGDAFRVSIGLTSLGHRVGLHVDERLMDFSRIEQTVVDIPVSFHCPTDRVLWRSIPGLESAYGPYWRDRYYSDGGGSFRFGDPEDDGGWPHDHMQINLHPDRWFAPEAHLGVPDEVYEDFFHEAKPS